MKILGVLLIIVSAVTISYLYEKKLKDTIFQLKEIKKLSEYIVNKIEYLSLPLDRVFARYGLDNKILVALTEKRRANFFESEIEDELYFCFSALGSGFKNDEIKRLNAIIVFLEKKIKEYEGTYKEKIKVFRAIAFFIALSFVIIMI